MKATCWMGKKNARVEEVPDPKILNSQDAIIRITSTAICGSDLHLYNGFVASMVKAGQTHVQCYMRPLLEKIQNGEIDPSFVVTHRMQLRDAADGYEIFNNKQDECVKVVLKT